MLVETSTLVRLLFIMITVLILTVLAATVTSHKCGKPPIPPRDIGKIVGGTIARPYSWPWQIELCAK
ncbi:hypothetical protein NECAME_17524, partial [Necator americanus]